MEVLHITNNYPTNKLPIFGVFVKEQIESLGDINVNNEILFINAREKGKIEYVRAIWKIREKVKDKRYDIIHCHHALSALCLVLSLKCFQNKVIVSFQNDPLNELGAAIFRIIKVFTDGLIFKNNSVLINDPFSFYLPNGVNTKLFIPIEKLVAREQLQLCANKIYILFVSSNRLRRQKRYDVFAETLLILKKTYGYHNIDEIKVINVKREVMPIYINAVDLHLLTSDFEGSPNSVKECMACNTPVVSTNVGNVSELLLNVTNSYVADNNTPEDIAKLVDKVLRTDSNLKNDGREKLLDLQLDIDSVARTLKEVYNKIINKK